MPANGRWDLIRRLKVNQICKRFHRLKSCLLNLAARRPVPKILSDVLTNGMQLFQLCQRTRTDASRVHTDDVAHTEVKEGQRRLKQIYRASYRCMAHVLNYTYQKPSATSLFSLQLPTQKKYRNIHFKIPLILGVPCINRVSKQSRQRYVTESD